MLTTTTTISTRCFRRKGIGTGGGGVLERCASCCVVLDEDTNTNDDTRAERSVSSSSLASSVFPGGFHHHQQPKGSVTTTRTFFERVNKGKERRESSTMCKSSFSSEKPFRGWWSRGWLLRPCCKGLTFSTATEKEATNGDDERKPGPPSFKDIDDSHLPPDLKRRALVANMRRFRRRKDAKAVQETFEALRKHHRYPGRGAYNVLVHCAADSGDPEAALEIVQSMVADNVVPDVTTHHGILLAFCRSGRVREAFEWLQMHCLGVPSSSLGEESGWDVRLKAPGEAVQLSEIFDEQDADADLPDDDDGTTEAARTMHQPAPQTALPVKLFTTLLRYAAKHASREIFQATEVLMFQMNQPNLTPGADALEAKLRLVGTCANGTSREVEEVWQMFKNDHKSMWSHS